MRKIYTVLFYLALPFLFIRLYWRSRHLKAYRERLPERLGFYPFKLKECIWVHAVSVGETLAAIPLIKALQTTYPDLPLLITTMTPTGAERVKTALADSVFHAYIPYDVPFAVMRFLDAMHPLIGIIMETELWPNLLACCHRRRIPVCLINARLSEKSALGYSRIQPLVRQMFDHIDIIAAHGQKDANRFIRLGATPSKVSVTGNIKFDLTIPDDLPHKSRGLRNLLGQNRFIWIAASTHAGEEAQILAAHRQLCAVDSEALLILAPRHPDRFDEVARMCETAMPITRRSLQEECEPTISIYLADTMGELLLLFSVCDAAFVGGSLIPHGGHNILEPAAVSKPILTGPFLENFRGIADLFIQANALTQVKDAEGLLKQLIFIKENDYERENRGRLAKAVIEANRGALNKQLRLIKYIFEKKYPKA